MDVCVLAGRIELFPKAELLAANFDFIFIAETFNGESWRKEMKRLQNLLLGFRAVLLVEDKGLSLLSLVNAKPSMSPIYIDFTNATWARRLVNISSRTELAAKAVAINKQDDIRVFDANAGLGQDSFVFAALGAKVLSCERSPLAFCLLTDALQRAQHDALVSEIAQRIDLVWDDALVRLKNNALGEVQSIYLDPMFPEKKHQALAKKEMQVFQQLIGADEDAEQLIASALDYLCAEESCTRVVIKRPRLAPVVFPEKLGRQLLGNSTRFDIYFKV